MLGVFDLGVGMLCWIEIVDVGVGSRLLMSVLVGSMLDLCWTCAVLYPPTLERAASLPVCVGAPG